jgi:hypothetical protein
MAQVFLMQSLEVMCSPSSGFVDRSLFLSMGEPASSPLGFEAGMIRFHDHQPICQLPHLSVPENGASICLASQVDLAAFGMRTILQV